MKKSLFCLCIVFAAFLILASCASETFDGLEDGKNVEKLAEVVPADVGFLNVEKLLPDSGYTLEQAVADGSRTLTVHKTVDEYGYTKESQELISDGDREAFLDALAKQSYSDDSYCSVSFFDEEGKLIEYTKYVYDGSGYHMYQLFCKDGNEETFSCDYQYLLSKNVNGRTFYAFSNDASLTYEAYTSAMLSSGKYVSYPKTTITMVLS